VPAEAAQEAADTIMKAGIRAILNFAPTFVNVPPEFALRNVDLTRQLEILSFHLPRLPSPPEEKPAAADT
jgi:redox-sensing transcriptional repressor